MIPPKEKQLNTKSILKELIKTTLKEKPVDKKWYALILDNPDILKIVIDNDKLHGGLDGKPHVLGISSPHTSLSPNPFTPEERRDIAYRMRSAIR